MPVYQLRTRTQILRQMVARVVARSSLKKLARNGAVFHILAAASDSDSSIYFQLARLRDIFSIDRATGSDLDERAREIQPAIVKRRLQIYATTFTVWRRTGTVGALPIPVGSIAAASDAQGRITYRTTAAGVIANGDTESAPIATVAAIAGSRANVDAGQINQIITRIPGVVGVTNPSDVRTGLDRETDDQFRQRIKDSVASLARGVVPAIEGFARSVSLTTGQRVVFARVFEPVVPIGSIVLYIDDGLGTVESTADTFVGGVAEADILIASAVGGETRALTTQRPQKDDPALIVYVNDVALTRGVDYEIDTTRGQIELLPASFPAGLSATDSLKANYRHYTGLIQEVQRVISGDPTTPLTHPGVEAGGITTFVRPPSILFQTLTATVVALQGFDLDRVRTQIRTAIQNYINNLNIGDDVILSEIIERAMRVDGVFNFQVAEISGNTSPADQIVLSNQAARIQSNDITLN